jgi:methylated-DNA-[protein]-cysteine S-methyltransferase
MYTGSFSSPVGTLNIRCDDEYVTEVLFSNEPCSEQTVGHPLIAETIDQFHAYFSGSLKCFTLPLRQEGTAFQHKVWSLLAAIPYGTTMSYQQLARHYGDLKAVRAVAAANGRNNLVIIVPCHRVIGSNQQLTGYGGGLARKKWLLDHEARYHSGVQRLFVE